MQTRPVRCGESSGVGLVSSVSGTGLRAGVFGSSGGLYVRGTVLGSGVSEGVNVSGVGSPEVVDKFTGHCCEGGLVAPSYEAFWGRRLSAVDVRVLPIFSVVKTWRPAGASGTMANTNEGCMCAVYM